MTAWLGDGSCADHGAGMPSGAYGSLHVGGGKFMSAPLRLAAGATASNANINVLDFGRIEGTIAASLDGEVLLAATASVSGYPYSEVDRPSTGTYSLWVATSPAPYQLAALMDLDHSGRADFGEPYAATGATIPVTAALQVRSNVNLGLTPFNGGAPGLSFTGQFSAAGGALAASALGWNELGYHVLVDTSSVGGPFAYVLFHSTPDPNLGYPMLSGIVKYDSAGVMLATAALLGVGSGEAFALDEGGNLYTNEQGQEHAPNYLVKFSPSLQRLATAAVSSGLPTDPYPTALTVSQGYLYAHLDGGNSGQKNYVAKYDLNLSLVASKQEAYSSAGFIAKNEAGDIYTLQLSTYPTATKLLIRYDQGLVSPLASADVTSLAAPRLFDGMAAYSNNSLFLVDVSTPGAWLAVRRFDGTTLAYSGKSSTYTISGLGFSAAIKAGPDGALYVAGSGMGPGGVDYLVLKYDTELHLVSSATFRGAGQQQRHWGRPGGPGPRHRGRGRGFPQRPRLRRGHGAAEPQRAHPGVAGGRRHLFRQPGRKGPGGGVLHLHHHGRCPAADLHPAGLVRALLVQRPAGRHHLLPRRIRGRQRQRQARRRRGLGRLQLHAHGGSRLPALGPGPERL